ncbi:hypothetical protein [Scopulibacillus cellulosilyticus]|uniref:Membrane protein YkvI n=1 Tax=Scopulibacillus cellulosilyticus TaxID=2665665 RepID=A0ABW2Q298_9BACL
MVKAGLKWMFLISGTLIGAGYASGRELWQFFGQESALAIFIFTILFIISTYVIMKISFDQKTMHYLPVLKYLLGDKIAMFYDFLILLNLFSTTVVMLAGAGTSLEIMHVPYWLGVALICICLILLFVRGNKGMVLMNAIVIPLLILLLTYVLIKFIDTTDRVLSFDWLEQSNWPSAFTFTALNILPVVAVLSAVGRDVKTKGEIWIASIGSGLIFGGMSFLYNQSLVKMINEIRLYEIPLFIFVKSYPYTMTIIMSFLLLTAIYTTSAAGVFGLITRFENYFRAPLWKLALVFILLMLPLTTFGFSTLVAVLYPIYGVLNLYLLAAILIYPIIHRLDNNHKIYKE